MTADEFDCDEEDEDVVIEGSDLHEVLHKMGYSDYAVLPAVRTQFSEQNINKMSSDSPPLHQSAFKWLSSLYHQITQESSAAEVQLKTIMQAQHLLDDHATVVESLLKHQPTYCKKAPLIGSTLAGIVAILLAKQKSMLASLLALPLMSAFIVRYTRWRANRDLRNIVSLQSDIYYLCKRGLKILRRSYGMKIEPKKVGSKFNELDEEKLQYLQPITETILNSIGCISHTYYQTTRIILNLLPEPHRSKAELLMTSFENETFIECGEITYTSLKRIHYTYILIQSEMMQLLATAYSCDIWCEHSGIPETKLAHIIYKLLETMTAQKLEMTKAIDSFYKSKTKTIQHKYRGIAGTKWQDLYVYLDLTSHKIQSAYDKLSLVLQQIDEETVASEFREELQQKMDDACREIENARNFAEFGRMLMYKMGKSTRQDQEKPPVNCSAMTLSKPEHLIEQNSSPEILDEVFEEYIKGEYLKEYYHDDMDDISSGNKKIDKLLSKNFMSELKEVLVDKHKSMSERESEALKRMKKTKTSLLEDEEEADDSSSDSEDDKEEKKENKCEFRQAEDSLDITRSDSSNFDRDQDPPPPPPLPPQCKKTSGFEIKIKRNANGFPPDSDDERGRRFNCQSEYKQLENSSKMGKSDSSNCNSGQNDNQEVEKSIPPPPPPPPLPQKNTIIGYDSILDSFSSMDPRHKPRNVSVDSESIQNYSVAPRFSNLKSVAENNVREQHCSISLNNFNAFSRPFMTVAEETFLGSGENSEEEVVDEEDVKENI